MNQVHGNLLSFSYFSTMTSNGTHKRQINKQKTQLCTCIVYVTLTSEKFYYSPELLFQGMSNDALGGSKSPFYFCPKL